MVIDFRLDMIRAHLRPGIRFGFAIRDQNTLDKPKFLWKVFIADGGWFLQELPPLFKQALTYFPIRSHSRLTVSFTCLRPRVVTLVVWGMIATENP